MFSAYSNGTAGKEPKSLRTKLQTALLFEWQCQAIRRICANVAASPAIRRKRNYSHHRKAQPRSDVSKTFDSAARRVGIFWRKPARIRVRGNVQRRLWADDAGAGARR